MNFKSKVGFTRRRLVQSAGAAASGCFMGAAAAAPATTAAKPDVYTRIGVRPFINMTATFTINGGAPMLPEVKQAMEEASQWAVNLDELAEKAGARIAQLLEAEAAIVTAGCAAALSLATAACVAGSDPEKMKRLPDATGLRNEVLIAKQSRNDYDHAFRSGGGALVEYDTPEQFYAAVGHRTAMVMILGTAEARGQLRLEEISKAAHKVGVPVLVDAAAELPLRPNPFLSRGADLVAYSGGKILRGPQSAGILMGRKDLVRAAWWNGSPHHAFARSMKVSKEEVMGMVTAVEMFVNKRKLDDEYRVWESWYKQISEEITKVPGIRTRLLPPAGASPFPVMEVAWDRERIDLIGDQVRQMLLDGEPRIMSHAEGESTQFLIRAVAMKPEHPPMVARRLVEVFRSAPAKGPIPKAAPAADITGAWEVDIEFDAGTSRHLLLIEPVQDRNHLRGAHVGSNSRGRFRGTIDGDSVRLDSILPAEGMRLRYRFRGRVQGGAMQGELDLGEFGKARWSARRAQG
jgi:L-seryl-tRNA(Ser) seleniumtransferase